jgi:subtilisin family serine protease
MDVTNNSYYIDPMEFWCGDQPDQAAVLEAVGRAVRWSTEQGVVHAAAAGNSAKDLANKTTDTASPNDTKPIARTINNGCKDIPTELPGVVTVSATNRSEQLASFSNRGLGVIDVAAPGRTILSTVVKDNGYGTKSGTSMASPHVAGVLALMKSAHPTWTPEQMVAKLRAQADDRPCSAPEGGTSIPCEGPVSDNSYYGEGIVDALDAVQ